MADEGNETVEQIVARIGDADPAELERLAADDRVGVQRAVEQEQARRAAAGDDEGIRTAQANTGRPPAEEVSLAHWERVYANQQGQAVNSDPEVLVDGERARALVVPHATAASDEEGGDS